MLTLARSGATGPHSKRGAPHGVELEWAALFVVAALGASLFDRFEIETPAWKKLLRWALAAGVTIGAYQFVGRWALAVLAAFAILGWSVHFIWCARNRIHPLTAEPRRRYYELRGWRWPEA